MKATADKSDLAISAADKKKLESLGKEIFQSLINYETAVGNLDPTPENILALICRLKKRIDAG